MASLDLIIGTLNEPQRKAVTTMQGPMLILAGAGSGKTKALTHRIAFLIEQGVPAWQILALTFTNRAAKEMKERIRSLLQMTGGVVLEDGSTGEGRLPIMGTFHSICVRILRRDIEHIGRGKNFVIYDDDDQEKLIKGILKRLHIDEKEIKSRAALSAISRMKSEGLSPKEALKDASTPRMQRIIQLYGEYQKALLEANALDFDDLILETVRLFLEVPSILERYQNTWRYLHVDEYQDTNHAQYLLISLLAKKERNICVIGDPDQSIYAFRGADIRNILEFEREYPDAVLIKLEQNYRSTQPILTGADAVIAANPNRPEKQMWTERKDGPSVIIHQLENERKEAEEAIKSIEKLQREGMTLNEQVILYRTHAQSRNFEEACMRAGIPYRILGGVKFYARREVKDILAYLHVIVNPANVVALLRIINVPSRRIGATTLERIHEIAQERSLPLWEILQHIEEIDALDAPVRERIAHFVQIIERFVRRSEEESVALLTSELIEEIEFATWVKDGTEEGEERWQNVKELLTVMQKYEGMEPRTGLANFLEEAALISEADKLSAMTHDAVTMMTLHLCKGLEFEHVMIVGCEEGIFPHANSLFDREQLAEERRLMYVGMTRSKTHLRLLCTRNRMLWGKTQANVPSRFLDDIPDSVLERRSDDILSSFAWTAARAGDVKRASGGKGTLSPYRQQTDITIEFNQDIGSEDTGNQDESIDSSHIEEGTRIEHPTFGRGTVTKKRGEIVEVLFENGTKKTLALSIAPIRLIA